MGKIVLILATTNKATVLFLFPVFFLIGPGTQTSVRIKKIVVLSRYCI